MKILRAHSYDVVERVRAELAIMPLHWQAAAEPWRFILLPDDLKPSWIGLVKVAAPRQDAAWGGRTWDNVGGWCASDRHDAQVRDAPHIYLNHSSVHESGIVVHETAHALSAAWDVDEAAFYRPERALYPYMATTPAEFFACALVAFLVPDGHDKRWNRLDMAKAVPDLHEYLTEKLRANT